MLHITYHTQKLFFVHGMRKIVQGNLKSTPINIMFSLKTHVNFFLQFLWSCVNLQNFEYNPLEQRCFLNHRK